MTVTCPHCHKVVPGLTRAQDGTLRTSQNVAIGSFWCGDCKRLIHWGVRGDLKAKEKTKR